LGDELWIVNQVVYSSGGGALRTMVKDILDAIDNEIACLEQAKALLSASGAVVAKRKPGRPATVATAIAPKVQKAKKRRKMSAETRERIRQAQVKRWAAQKGTSKANMNATVAPLPKAKKKATKAA
jgi:F0F1-type ATP synthase membrane subunit b/b'